MRIFNLRNYIMPYYVVISVFARLCFYYEYNVVISALYVIILLTEMEVFIMDDKYTVEEFEQMESMGNRINKNLMELDWQIIQKELPYKKNPNQSRKTFVTNKSIADEFGLKRGKVDLYINGHEPIDALTLLKFCKKLDCEAGYILGEFDEKRRTDADVKKITGLSPKALESLNKNNNSVIYEKASWNQDGTNVILAPMDEHDTIPAHSKYSDVLNTILVHHPEIIKMIGRILFCKELHLEHFIEDKFVSGLQQNAQHGIVQNNTFEMCMSLAMYLYHLSEDKGEYISPSLSVSDNFKFAQEYISNHVIDLTSENTHLKEEIINMEQDSGYQFGARPY